MKIEYLYPEICCLYGEHANVTYIERSVPGCEVIGTSVNEKPKFLDAQDIDLVYMGTMTEESQEIVIDRLRPFLGGIRSAVERGQFFLITGNAMEVFGHEIKDVGKLVFVKSGGGTVKGLGLINIRTERDMLNRYNSLWLGSYEGIRLTGLRSQFTRSFYTGEPEPLFKTERGPGLSPDTDMEGYRHNNFCATYSLGPLMIMNPPFMVRFLSEMEISNITPAFADTANRAYEERVAEYSNPNTGFIYD